MWEGIRDSQTDVWDRQTDRHDGRPVGLTDRQACGTASMGVGDSDVIRSPQSHQSVSQSVSRSVGRSVGQSVRPSSRSGGRAH